MRTRFRFRAIPFVATVLLVALGVSLGQWQDRRAASKTRLQATLTERSAAAPVVRVRDLCTRLGGKRIFDGVAFDVARAKV